MPPSSGIGGNGTAQTSLKVSIGVGDLSVRARVGRQQRQTDIDRRAREVAGAQLVGLVGRRHEAESRGHREVHDHQRHQRDSQQNRQQRDAALALSQPLYHCCIAIGTVTWVAKSITRPPGAAI